MSQEHSHSSHSSNKFEGGKGWDFTKVRPVNQHVIFTKPLAAPLFIQRACETECGQTRDVIQEMHRDTRTCLLFLVSFLVNFATTIRNPVSHPALQSHAMLRETGE